MSILSLVTALIGLNFAAAEPLPVICAAVQCTEKMQAIERGLYGGTNVDRAELPAVYSGECFHLSPSYNPNHTHYGMTFLETRGSEIFFNGSFGFFYSENPWANWTVEDARKNTPNPYKFPTEEFENYSYIDWGQNEPGVIWKHWLSQDPQTKTIYLVSFWGFTQQSFCELKPNRK